MDKDVSSAFASIRSLANLMGRSGLARLATDAACKSSATPSTTFLMPLSALSGELASQESDGNSVHKPMYALSKADQ